MTEDPQRPAVDLGKSSGDDRGEQPSGSTGGSAPEPPFDPYRFGRPEHPVPPEYAPPGYVPDPPTSPYTGGNNTPSGPYGPPPAPYSGQYPRQSGYGQPGYGQGNYGPGTYGQQAPWSPPPTPPYGNYPDPNQKQGSNGKAVAGLVLGIASIVMCWLAFFNIIFLVLGVIFGILGMSDAKTRQGAGRGMALAGLICTGVGFVVTTLYTVWILNVSNQCGGLGNGNDPGFSQCIRDHL